MAMAESDPAYQLALAARAKAAGANKSANHRAVNGRLLEHMIEISGDPSGSEPEDYFDEPELEKLERLFEAASASFWPASMGIDLQLVKKTGFPAWKKPLHNTKSTLTKSLFMSSTRTPHMGSLRGYHIGHVNITPVPNQPVVLCSDGLLRSQRGRELPRSEGVGWGRLPDIDILQPAVDLRATNNRPVTWDPYDKGWSLDQRLAGVLPDNHQWRLGIREDD